MTPWSALLPDVLPQVSGVPRVVALHAIKRATQQLLQTSRLWKVLTPETAVAASAVVVTPDLGEAHARLVRIEQAWWDGRELGTLTLPELRGQGADWSTRAGPVDALVHLTPLTVRPFPLPEAPGSIKLLAALCPGDEAVGMPDDIAALHGELIAAGALGRLMLMDGKPWTKLQQGSSLAAGFATRCDEMASEADASGHSPRVGRTTPIWC